MAFRATTILTCTLLLTLAPLQARGRKVLPAVAKVVQGSNQLAVDLYGRVRKEKQSRGKNIFFSPYSISTALAMTYAGARGETAKQMARVLHFTLAQAALHPAYKGLLDSIATASSRDNQLRVANALWGQKGFRFLDSFLALTRKSYGAGLSPVDFRNQTEAARKTINRWVEKKTERKIVDLIPPGVLTNLTRLVLTNAIYFKGTWETQFPKKSTRPRPFTLLGGKQVQAPMMQQTAKVRYADLGEMQAVELPYKGARLSMVVLLPKKTDGLPGLEKKLSPALLTRAIGKLKRRKVRVLLPRFKSSSTFMLSQALKAMGMPLAFSDSADFTGMAKKAELKITEVVHKAFVDVNEEGTEAAAATAVVVGLRGLAAPTPELRADHPFLFLIRERATGTILFLGRLMDPR